MSAENNSTVSKPYQVITERILALLEQGTIPWQRPWQASEGCSRNLISQKPYRGINVWILGSAGYTSPYWLTFKQAKEKGGHVRQGEKGWPIVFWKIYDRPQAEGDDTDRRFVLRYYTVFNVAQCEGVEAPVIESTPTPFTPIEVCEKLVGNMPQRPAITHGGGQAFYQPSSDIVHMPEPTTFTKREAYYSTLFHELTHSTGHPDRLKRPTLMDLCKFGDTNYSKEELVAEMGAAYLCGLCGIENATIDNSAAYIKSWMSRLRHEPKLLVQAAAQAQRAADFISNTTAQPEQEA